MKQDALFGMPFSKLYPLYVAKAEKKGRTKAEVDIILCCLTGHTAETLAHTIDSDITLEAFFREAPQMNPHTDLITGTICGVRIEAIEDPLMRKIRVLDKLIDALAKGKPMEKILEKL